VFRIVIVIYFTEVKKKVARLSSGHTCNNVTVQQLYNFITIIPITFLSKSWYKGLNYFLYKQVFAYGIILIF